MNLKLTGQNKKYLMMGLGGLLVLLLLLQMSGMCSFPVPMMENYENEEDQENYEGKQKEQAGPPKGNPYANCRNEAGEDEAALAACDENHPEAAAKRAKMEEAKSAEVAEAEAEGFSNNGAAQMCYPKDQVQPAELLPQGASQWAEMHPNGQGSLDQRNYLYSGHHIGINTVGNTLRNANQGFRSEPANPQVATGIWMQSTIEPDMGRRPLEIGGCA